MDVVDLGALGHLVAARVEAGAVADLDGPTQRPGEEAALGTHVEDAPANQRGIDVTDEAVTEIIEHAHGYPYFLQEWGYHVWNAASGSPIDRPVVDGVTPRVVKHLDDNFFLVRFDRLTPAEKKYLRAMAELGPGPHRSGDIASALGVRVESVAPRRSALISKGMIYSPAHGDTAFTVPLFDEFLQRAMP